MTDEFEDLIIESYDHMNAYLFPNAVERGVRTVVHKYMVRSVRSIISELQEHIHTSVINEE